MKKLLSYFTTILSFFIVAQLSGQNPNNFKCGDHLVDSRDEQQYHTVLIGDQCWMAENLNFGTVVSDMNQQDNGIAEKTCYENDHQNCFTLGGLYTWRQAMNFSDNHQGICPAGWRVPSKDDWERLSQHLGIEEAGQHMKVDRTHSIPWDGNNSSGFSAIPAGVGYEGFFGRKNQWVIFWSSTAADGDYAWFSQLDNYWYPAPPKYKILYIGDHFVKENGFSIRCIQK